MAFTVRVRDFQAIKDVTLRVSGLTVVTGTNNSGKTSLMRAVRGVFTNPPAGPLVRLGSAYLSVDLTFDDGHTLTWEKGHEKPGGKGKAINRYTIDGKTLEGVGRGVPSEIEALGVRGITAGSEETWPQIARQFDGNLFLVDRPGSVVAEALSDVERVGKLSDALRASESDRRAVVSEVKIRRADCVRLHDRLKQFGSPDSPGGFDEVLDQIKRASQTHVADLDATALKLAALRELAARLEKAREQVAGLAGFSANTTPLGPTSEAAAWREVSGLAARLGTALKASQDYKLHVTVPSLDVPCFLSNLRELDNLQRLKAAKKAAEAKTVLLAPSDLADLLGFGSDKLTRYSKGAAILRVWSDRYSKSLSEIVSLNHSLGVAHADLTLTVQAAHEALHDMGNCPTCGGVT